MKTGRWLLAVLLAGCAGILAVASQAQTAPSSGPSDALAAAARRAKEEKKNQTKSATVFTNENLPTTSSISVVGQGQSESTSAPAAASTPAAAATPAAAGSDEKKAAANASALAAAKERVASLKKDLDIQQRKYTLDQQTYLSNPNHASDTSGASALQVEQGLINGKQEDVDQAQKAVDELMAKMPAPATPADAPATSPSPSDEYNPLVKPAATNPL